MKKIVSLVIISTLILLSGIAFGNYEILHEVKGEVEYLANGVTKQNILRFTNEGWLNINIIKVDLTQNAELTVVTDKHLSQRDTLTNLVNKNNTEKTIVAAINSDFFDTANGTTMGNLVKDGRVLTTSIGMDEFASFNLTNNNLPYVGYINSPQNSFTNGRYTQKITYINKPYLQYDRSVLFTRDWAIKSYGNTLGSDILEMLIVDDVIAEIRRRGEPFIIPENGYVISCVGKDIADVRTNFAVGDAITVNYDINFRVMNLSVGGGAQILVNGRIPEKFSQNITGKHPRSSIGISRDRKQLIMATIDGRGNSYRGVTQTELANIMLEFGAFEAINLDGGGSSQMVAKSPWKNGVSIVNNPSDGTERKMYTGLAVKKIISQTPELLQIKVNMESDKLLLGVKVPISLAAIDSNHNPFDINIDEIKWELKGIKGSIKDGFLTAEQTGSGILIATYRDKKIEKSIRAYDNAVKLNVAPGFIKIDNGEVKKLSFSITTEYGATIKLPPTAIKVTVPESIGSYNSEHGDFVAGGIVDQGFITCEFNGLRSHIPVAVGTSKTVIENFEGIAGKFVSFPELVTGSYKEISGSYNGSRAGELVYDFSTVTQTRAAYLEFMKPLILPENTQSVGVWVLGDGGNDHWLRGKITDSMGMSANITFARNVNWSGWKFVTAEIPSSLSFPISFERLYLVETEADRLDSGTILFDDITAIMGNRITIEVPSDITRIKEIGAYKIPEKLKNRIFEIAYSSNSKNNGSIAFKDSKQKMSIEDKNNSFIVRINNSNGSIRRNDYTQWKKLFELVNRKLEKPVIVIMNDVEKFNDSLEGELFYRQMELLYEKGIDVTVIYPTTSEKFSLKNINGVRTIFIPLEKSALRLASEAKKLHFEVK